MLQQEFLGHILSKNQRILSLMGPSGTGKSFSAEFIKEYLDYRIAKQITTRDKRPDDTHYEFISRQEFVDLENQGKILGLFAGDKHTLQGNGYGYIIEEVLEQLQHDNKLILFPSAYELNNPNFGKQYGTSHKIGLGFTNFQNVKLRALQCDKVFSEEELQSRIKTAATLTEIMENYARKKDETFKLIYSDSDSLNIQQSKILQLQEILSFIGYNPNDFKNQLEEYTM